MSAGRLSSPVLPLAVREGVFGIQLVNLEKRAVFATVSMVLGVARGSGHWQEALAAANFIAKAANEHDGLVAQIAEMRKSMDGLEHALSEQRAVHTALLEQLRGLTEDESLSAADVFQCICDDILNPAGMSPRACPPSGLDDEELATTLAALRYWQREVIAKEGLGFIQPESEFFQEDGVQPLDEDAIDELCERLNTGG